jgi:hypothetical protein
MPLPRFTDFVNLLHLFDWEFHSTLLDMGQKAANFIFTDPQASIIYISIHNPWSSLENIALAVLNRHYRIQYFRMRPKRRKRGTQISTRPQCMMKGLS